MMSSVGVEVLVADSGAFIKAAPLEKWAGRVFTVKEVVEEIRDVHTRRRLQVLPYELVFREPSQEALHHVTMFAKKTGDYGSLSHVDMKVMALTYQLECELGPEKGANLRKEPQKTQPAVERNQTPNMVGFYSGSGRATENTTKTDSNASEASSPEVRTLDKDGYFLDRTEQDHSEVHVPDLETRVAAVSITENGSKESNKTDNKENLEQILADNIGVTKCDSVNGSTEKLEWNGDTVDGGDLEWEGKDDDDDDSGWITPENFHQACEEMGGVLEEKAAGIRVGCTTTDFAMQNVMLQIGLNVISVDGMRIKQLRTYAMRCKACFRSTSNTAELFCPHCGNRTLIKVSVLLDENGTTHYRHLSDKQFSHKGLRYSLPLPKGGRHAHNPILVPDQRVTQKERRSRTNKINPLDPDYIALESPFAMKDVTSRGAKIASKVGGGSGRMDGRRRRNPNAVQPKGRKK